MMRRTTTIAILLAGLTLAAAPRAAGAAEDAKTKTTATPSVEVVFVLDTTGSMSGLIEGAKTKIWKIVNRIVSGKPVPRVKVGLVAYRDRSDAYVTKVTGLTDDLDRIYGTLRGFSAGGGGDTPESVNQALHEAVTKMEWSRHDRVLRIIYLVGDAPPHMDYANDVKYPVTCEAAARAGIIINTVQCGSMGATTPIWQDIARKAEGRFVQISQGGGMVAVATPYDKRLAELDRELSGTAVFYGSRRDREAAKRALDEADDAVASAAPEAAAERAGYRSKSGRTSSRDLLAMLESGELDRKDLKKDQLPEELQKLDDEALAKRLDELLARRKALRQELLELDRKRAAHIKAELEKKGRKGDAFDEQVLDALRDQAKKVGLEYE